MKPLHDLLGRARRMGAVRAWLAVIGAAAVVAAMAGMFTNRPPAGGTVPHSAPDPGILQILDSGERILDQHLRAIHAVEAGLEGGAGAKGALSQRQGATPGEGSKAR